LDGLHDLLQKNKWKDLGSALNNINVKAKELQHRHSIRCLLTHEMFSHDDIHQNLAQTTVLS